MICSNCSVEMDLDHAWRPKGGFDPILRKYRCGKCRRVVYGFPGRYNTTLDERQMTLDAYLSPGTTKHGAS